MTDEDLPTVLCEGVVEVKGMRLRVLVLSDGNRVIPADEARRFAREKLGIELLGDVAMSHFSVGGGS